MKQISTHMRMKELQKKKVEEKEEDRRDASARGLGIDTLWGVKAS